MPATVRQRGILKPSQNRVRTSTALQGNAMWENVIGVTHEMQGTNQGVEALINAPTIGGGRKATLARRQAAAEAVMATGGFDTSITNYQSLLAIAKQQGAVGSGARGACKVCGQTGHLTKQCRNALGGGADGGDGAGGSGAPLPELLPPEEASDGDDSLSLSSDSSDEERRRKKRRKEKKRKEKEKSRKRSKEKRRRKEKREKKERRKEKKRRRGSDSGSSSSSGSDSD